MANFAELDNNNKVLRVLGVEDSQCLDEQGQHSEMVGITYLEGLFGGRWIETYEGDAPRKNFAGIGMTYFPNYDAFMFSDKPHPWYEIGEGGQWRRPANINDLTGEPFTHDELRYIGYHERNTRLFIFCPAVAVDNTNEFFQNACNTDTSFMFPMFSELEQGRNITEEAVGATVENNMLLLPGIELLRTVVDAIPIGIIEEVKFSPLFLDTMFHYHPQSAGRTPHELFRLILEWDFAHTELGNTEMVSKYCHDLINKLQMPEGVKTDLLNIVPPQAVELYIRGLDPFRATSFDIIQDPPFPDSFRVWYQSISIGQPIEE